MPPVITREWAMPHKSTFSVGPIASFVARHTSGLSAIVDPFCGDSTVGTHRNDLKHGGMDAEAYCHALASRYGTGWADAVIFDPPYSPRQISEVYKSVGMAVGMAETQNASLYKRVRSALWPLLKTDGVALSFGWNSAGFGSKRGAEVVEILMVAHGGAHNDTICVAERKAEIVMRLPL